MLVEYEGWGQSRFSIMARCRLHTRRNNKCDNTLFGARWCNIIIPRLFLEVLLCSIQAGALFPLKLETMTLWCIDTPFVWLSPDESLYLAMTSYIEV